MATSPAHKLHSSPGIAPAALAGAALPHVVVVDDEESVRYVIARAMESRGLRVKAFAALEPARAWLTGNTALIVFLDLRLGDGNGLDLLAESATLLGETPVVVVTACEPEETTIAAIQKGAHDYVSKPFSLDKLDALADGAIARYLETQVAAPVGEPAREEAAIGPAGLIGRSPAMIKVFKSIGRLAGTDVNVLITGESGTGKERTAYAIHLESRRREGPFVTVNTAAIPYELLENELFGHVAGAFTGAQTRYRGRFEQAGGGTLFLDEIGDMPLGLQVKLLRAVQERVIYPLGAEKPVTIDCRIIAATNNELSEAMREKKFREDLYYRLAVGEIQLPALRERGDDILRIADQVLRRFAADLGVEGDNRLRLTREARELLKAYDWPGNVRELENVLRRASLDAIGGLIHAADLAPMLPGAGERAARVEESATGFNLMRAASGRARELLTDESLHGDIYRDVVEQVEDAMFDEVLAFTRGNRIRAAALLGINRNTLALKLKRRSSDENGDESEATDAAV